MDRQGKYSLPSNFSIFILFIPIFYLLKPSEEVTLEENFKFLNFNNQNKKPEGCFPKLSDAHQIDPKPFFSEILPSENKTESMQEVPSTQNEAIHPEEAENDSEDEGMEDYKLGGYHPVHIGYILIHLFKPNMN